jgi:hypothetical protein
MMNRMLSILCVAPLALAACTAQVVLPGGEGGSGGSSGSGTTDPVGSASVAMTRAQSDAAWAAYWASHGGEPGSSSASGGGGLDPNDLFLRVSDLGVSCGSPTTDLPCGGHWDMTLVLPSGSQKVGVYNLEDPALEQYSVLSETGAPNSTVAGDCPAGGGSLGSGTVEIVFIDETQVKFQLTVTNPLSDSDPSGMYTAARCP